MTCRPDFGRTGERDLGRVRVTDQGTAQLGSRPGDHREDSVGQARLEAELGQGQRASAG